MQSKISETIVNLFLTYSADLYDYAFYRIQDSQAAEDLVQTVFMLACTKIKEVPEEKRRPWLYGVMRNQIRTYFRRINSHKEIMIADEKTLCLSVYEMELPDDESLFPPGLKNTFREILKLRAVDQLEYNEIAQKLGISEESARQRFSRAVKAYKKLQGTEKNLTELSQNNAPESYIE